MTPRPFAQGDHVKLTERGRRAYHAVKHGCIDWRKRVGVVVNFKRSGGEAYVRWEGRTSLDVVSIKILERE